MSWPAEAADRARDRRRSRDKLRTGRVDLVAGDRGVGEAEVGWCLAARPSRLLGWCHGEVLPGRWLDRVDAVPSSTAPDGRDRLLMDVRRIYVESAAVSWPGAGKSWGDGLTRSRWSRPHWRIPELAGDEANVARWDADQDGDAGAGG